MPGVSYIQQFRIQGPDGTVIYAGSGQWNAAIEIHNNEASATINAGEAVKIDSTNIIIPRIAKFAAGTAVDSDIPNTETYRVKRIAAASDILLVAVAQQPITFGTVGWAASTGSTVGVTCLASPTSATLGACVIGSSTAGSVDLIALNTAGSATNTPAQGTVLGLTVKLPGTSAGQTGSTTVAGVFISPR